jgi:hypothetical protein
MAFSTFSSVNSLIKYPSGGGSSSSGGPTDSLLFFLKFNSGEINGSHYCADYATGSAVYTTALCDSSLSISTSTYKVGSGSLNTGTNQSANLISLPNYTLTGSFSICFWLNFNLSNVFNPRILQFNLTSGTSNLCIRYISNQLIFDILEAGPCKVTYPNSYSNVWTHIVVMCNSSGTKYIYVNGVQGYSGSGSTLSSLNTTTNSMYIIPNGSYNILGYMDDFRFYSRVLTSTEINSIYTAT